MKRHIPTPIMHRVVESDGLVFVGGTIADDDTLGMKDQADSVFSKIDSYLAEAGTDKTKILSCTIFVTDLAQKAEMNAAWQDWLEPAHMPTRATIGVADLGGNILIEVTAVARK